MSSAYLYKCVRAWNWLVFHASYYMLCNVRQLTGVGLLGFL